MITKETNDYGKTVQQDTCSSCGQHTDHSQKYKDWVRRVNKGHTGVWTDLDLIKIVKRQKEGVYQVTAITDLTFAKSHKPSYLDAICDRWFSRDEQGKMFQGISQQLGVPAYLVAYGDNQVSVLDINDPEVGWTTYQLDQWEEVINTL